MDSGNSGGSLQSSSGADDDYHESSRAAAVADSFSSPFFNHQSFPPAAHVTSYGQEQQPPPPPPPAFFDPLASYLDQLSRSANPNPVLNSPDPVWPKEALIGVEHNNLTSSGFNSAQPSSSSNADRQPSQAPSARNPRKRTRASRRAPTTVLTTDTSNFRAMVQEFTGIPAPPFGSSAGAGTCSSSLFFPRTRLDLFGGGLHAPQNPTPLPPYLLRPLAQKLSPPPVASTVTTTTKHHDVITASSSQYQIPSNSDLGLLSFVNYSPDPGSTSKAGAGAGGSLELPIPDHLSGLTASFLSTADAVNVNSSSNGKSNGVPLGWADGLGLGADAGAGEPANAPSGNAAHHSHSRGRTVGFGRQQIG